MKNSILKIKFSDIEELIKASPDLWEEISGMWELDHPLVQYLSECTQEVFQDFNRGLYNIDQEHETIGITLSPLNPNSSFQNLFKIQTALPDWVMRSYNDELYPWEIDAWDHYKLGRDINIDYSGPYLMVFNDAIHFYLIKTKMIYKNF